MRSFPTPECADRASRDGYIICLHYLFALLVILLYPLNHMLQLIVVLALVPILDCEFLTQFQTASSHYVHLHSIYIKIL